MTGELPPAVIKGDGVITLSWRGLMGEGYDWLLTHRGRYIFIAGARGSKKSTNVARKMVLDLFSTDYVNVLVVRRYYTTHRDSTFAAIVSAIDIMGLTSYVKINNSTLTITRYATGQKIKFAGLDEPEKLKSLQAEHGVYSRLWVEEVSEVESSEAFDILDLSIRGILPEGAYHQIICTFNPHRPFWVKTQFYDRVSPSHPSYDPEFAKECICMHTTAFCNEWLPQDFLRVLQSQSAKLARTNLLGEWGELSGVSVLTNWEVWYPENDEYPLSDLTAIHGELDVVCGLDFGYKHPAAFVSCGISRRSREVWVVGECTWHRAYLAQIAADLKKMGYNQHRIVADAAEPKSIAEMRDHHGFKRIRASRKGKDSKHYGVQYLNSYKIHVHHSCKELIAELITYRYDDKGALPDEADDHIDALRYAVTSVGKW